MIKKIGGKYVVLSEKTGRRFGTYATLAEAKKRLRQVEFFKHRADTAKKGDSGRPRPCCGVSCPWPTYTR